MEDDYDITPELQEISSNFNEFVMKKEFIVFNKLTGFHFTSFEKFANYCKNYFNRSYNSRILEKALKLKNNKNGKKLNVIISISPQTEIYYYQMYYSNDKEEKISAKIILGIPYKVKNEKDLKEIMEYYQKRNKRKILCDLINNNEVFVKDLFNSYVQEETIVN